MDLLRKAQKGLWHKMTPVKVRDVLIKSWLLSPESGPQQLFHVPKQVLSQIATFLNCWRKLIFFTCFTLGGRFRLLRPAFTTWNSRKSKKLRALLLVQLLKVATGDHFQDSKVKIWLKHPGLLLLSFFAPGPFENWRFWKMHFFWVGHFDFFFCFFPN